MQIRVLKKRIHTLKLTVWSRLPIVDGDGEEFADSGEVLRKKTLKLGRLLAPLDACFCTNALRVEAHLLDLIMVAGAAPVVGFISDPGDYCETVARNREVRRAAE
jgi:hypothetical protein